jgi:hypothetical protein
MRGLFEPRPTEVALLLQRMENTVAVRNVLVLHLVERSKQLPRSGTVAALPIYVSHDLLLHLNVTATDSDVSLGFIKGRRLYRRVHHPLPLTPPIEVSSPPLQPGGLFFCSCRARLLALPLWPLISRCDQFRRPGKSSGPPPFAPSLNVQGDDTHNNSKVFGDSTPSIAKQLPEVVRMAMGTTVFRIRIELIFRRC